MEDPKFLPRRRTAFRNWLKKGEPTSCVGKPCSATECPLHTYLCELNPDLHMDDIYVYGDATRIHVMRMNPLWAMKFVKAVDDMYGDSSGRYVTYQEALEILNSIR